MKHISKFLTAALLLTVLTACGNDNQKPATASGSSDKTFALISDKCQLIGAVNINEIYQIESIKKISDENNKSIPYYKEVEASGFGVENIQYIYFGAEMPTTADQANFQPEGIFILKAKAKVNLDDFIALAEKNNNVEFKTEQIGSKKAYVVSAETGSPATYIVQVNDNTIAIGTKNEATATVVLSEKTGKSVLDNATLMTAANNCTSQDMLWIAASVPKELNDNNDPSTPDINDLFVSANYENENLIISGKVDCATEKDVQKIMMPAQIVMSMAVMGSDNTIKPEDIVLKADKSSMTANIKLSKAALENLAGKAAQEAPEIDTQALYVEEDIIIPDTASAQDKSGAIQNANPQEQEDMTIIEEDIQPDNAAQAPSADKK